MFITIAPVWLLVVILVLQDLRIGEVMFVLRNHQAVVAVSRHIGEAIPLREDIVAEVLLIVVIVVVHRIAAPPLIAVLRMVVAPVVARHTMVAHRIVAEMHEVDSSKYFRTEFV